MFCRSEAVDWKYAGYLIPRGDIVTFGAEFHPSMTRIIKNYGRLM